MFYISLLALILAIIFFLFVAWYDFKNWKIKNRSVLILILIFIIHAFSAKLGEGSLGILVDPIFSLFAGVILFSIGFVLWIFKMLGAGDAKLLFPIGLFISWESLVPFSVGLIIVGVVLFLLLKFPLPVVIKTTFIGMRLDEIRATKKIPYAVVMVIPTIFLIYVRYTSIL